VISDEGSGDWVGRLATAAAMRSFDTGQSTTLNAKILNAWGVATREDIIRIVNSYPPPNFSSLFPHVLAASDAGDSIAHEVLTRAGTELAGLARIVIRKLWPGDTAVHIAGSGGVIRNSSVIRQVMHNAIRSERKNVVYDETEVDPIIGALFLARAAQQKRQASAES
jgi:glucosamine kinase